MKNTRGIEMDDKIKSVAYEEIVWLEDCISKEIYPYSLRLGKLSTKEFAQYVDKKPMKIILEFKK